MIGVVGDPLGWSRWNEVKTLLQGSLDRMGDTMADIEAALQSNALLWVSVGEKVNFAAVGQIFKKGDKTELFIWHGGGDDTHGALVRDAAEQWCRNNGFSAMEMNGRIGWMRRLKDWKPVSVTLRKEL